jgi:hypothetical protein
MNEAILFTTVVMTLLFAQFLINRIKKPLSHYLKIISAIALLILVWVFGDEAKLPVKVILTTIMLTVLYKEYLSIKKASL